MANSKQADSSNMRKAAAASFTSRAGRPHAEKPPHLLALLALQVLQDELLDARPQQRHKPRLDAGAVVGLRARGAEPAAALELGVAAEVEVAAVVAVAGGGAGGVGGEGKKGG
jgi:hypothetical protein